MLTFIMFILLFTVLIMVHEAGHLIAAKKFGVYCYEFSFGMGPLLFSKKFKETQYSIRALPIGGYVAMAGEEGDDEVYPGVQVPEGRRITDQVWWKRAIIQLAGIFNNILLAYFIFCMVVLAAGGISTSPEPVVDSVIAGSAAEAAGFEAGDRIIEIQKEDGSSIKPAEFIDMQTFITDDSTLTITVERDGTEEVFTVTPEYSEEEERYMIGVNAPEGKVTEVNLLNCWYYGAYEMVMLTRLMFQAIINIFQGAGLSNLSGPVGIYQATETYVKMGFESYMLLIAQLSLNLGIFNALPLPVLDGGQFVITVAEAVTRRRLNEKIRVGLMLTCWALLIGLMIYVTWNDVVRLF